MSTKSLLSVADVRSGNGAPGDINATHKANAIRTALIWMDGYITKRHPEIGRPEGAPQVICPFLGISMRKNMLSLAVHPEIKSSKRKLLRCVSEYAEQFMRDKCENADDEQYRAYAIIFPNIERPKLSLLSEVQSRLKDVLVPKGYMIGEFYETCTVPAAHNANFHVMWSPIPLMAIRNMLPHDVLFLKKSKEMFLHFDQRFGSHFAEPEKLPSTERHLIAHYEAARAQFA